jgi:hypothetical protein
MNVTELDDVLPYLEKRDLLPQYVKAKRKLQKGDTSGVQLRKRQPKSSDVWYFRINRQYRAFCFRDGDTLVVFEVNDHQ